MRYFEDIYSANPRPFGEGPSDVVKALSEHLTKTRQGAKLNILDLGCGYGRDCVFLAKAGHNVTGIDTSRRGIMAAQNWVRQEGLDIRLLTKDIMETGLADKAFDAIVCVGVLEYLDPRKRPKVGHEIWRLAAQGCLLALMVLSTEDPGLGKGKDLGENTWEVKPGLPVHFYTEREIRQTFPDFKEVKANIITVQEGFPEPKASRYWLYLGQRP